MKGITPVVATILLLLITVVIVGIVMVFFQRTVSGATGATEETLGSQTSQSAKIIRITNANCVSGATTVSMRNSGTQGIIASDVSVFIDNVIKSCSWADMPVAAGGSATCTITEAGDSSSKKVKVVSPGNIDVVVCA